MVDVLAKMETSASGVEADLANGIVATMAANILKICIGKMSNRMIENGQQTRDNELNDYVEAIDMGVSA